MGRLDGKVILISGGAPKRKARRRGATVRRRGRKRRHRRCAGGRGQPTGERTGSRRSVRSLQDVTREANWEKAVEAAAEFGGLHGLVNNAGIYQPKTLMETDAALFERHMRINQLGCFLGMKAVVPLMEQSGSGSIVNISSVAGLRGSPGAINYSATKWALREPLTKAAAVDLARRKIRVNSIHPGPIDTEMLQVRTPEQNERRLQLVPMKRMGTAEEVASLVLFLLSDESGYITGSEVAIDGGATTVAFLKRAGRGLGYGSIREDRSHHWGWQRHRAGNLAGAVRGRVFDCALPEGRRRGMLEETASLAKAMPPQMLARYLTDVSDPASIAALFATVKATYGRIDLLFNNAGISTRNIPIEDLTLEQWSNVVAVNLTGSFLCAQHAFRMMKDQQPRGGRIINKGSVSAHVPRRNTVPYAATKHALTGLTR